MRGLVIALLVLLATCRSPREQGASQGEQNITLDLNDSIPFENELESGYLHRVTIRQRTTKETIPGVLVRWKPVLVGDSLVIGVAFDTMGSAVDVFQHSVPRRVTQTVPVPDDFMEALTELAFSPDGRHVAYVRFPRDGTGIGIVRQWPSRSMVRETQAVTVAASDAFMGAARWVDSNHFEIMIAPFGGHGWVRFRGSLDSTGIVQDTVTPGR